MLLSTSLSTVLPEVISFVVSGSDFVVLAFLFGSLSVYFRQLTDFLNSYIDEK